MHRYINFELEIDKELSVDFSSVCAGSEKRQNKLEGEERKWKEEPPVSSPFPYPKWPNPVSIQLPPHVWNLLFGLCLIFSPCEEPGGAIYKHEVFERTLEAVLCGVLS